jgi:uncharacterized protein YodC (DUF2158 family)
MILRLEWIVWVNNIRDGIWAGPRMVVSNISRLMGVQEVRWEGSGTEPAGEYTFFYGDENHVSS